MSTTTDVREEHLSKEEVDALAHPKRPLKQRVGVVLSYVGMDRNSPVLHHSLLLDGRLLAANPD